MSMRDAMTAGDIVRDRWTNEEPEHLNLYLGSGRCGACFDGWGLMNEPLRRTTIVGRNPTVLMHADGWHRNKFGKDEWEAIGRLRWAGDSPALPSNYSQRLSLFEGRLQTECICDGLMLRIENWFDPKRRDHLNILIEHEGDTPAIMLDLTPNAVNSTAGDGRTRWHCRIPAALSEAEIGLRIISEMGDASLTPVEQGLKIKLNGEKGRHLLVISTVAASRASELNVALDALQSIEETRHSAAAAWERRWGNVFVQLPIARHQAMWARSLFYVLSTYGPDVASPAPPMGWTGISWNYNFPQDLSYIHPALLRLGHFDIAKSWVEFFHSTIGSLQKYTRRVFAADGVMWPWNMPIGPDAEIDDKGDPAHFQYQIHNAAYPARMAFETARALDDHHWSRAIAWPIVLASAQFYSSILTRGPDGIWGEHVIPSMGQDELGGLDAPNYLDALYSARYTLKTALDMARSLQIDVPEASRWATILHDGLVFDSLLDPRLGIYSTNAAIPAAEVIGKEKHPIQLNPLVFLPFGTPDEPVLNAYRQRHRLCSGMENDIFLGWTLQVLWLSTVHMGDATGFSEELARMEPWRATDRDWIQLFEVSGRAPYFVTGHGLYLQAVCDAFVNDYFGDVRIGAAVPGEWSGALYSGLHAGGERHSNGG